MARRRKNGRSRHIWRWALGGVVVLLALLAGYLAWVFDGSLPTLEGQIALSGLGGPVEIVRDQAGVPTVSAANRTDLARALGFLHGQERFFQMDLLRRAGAGELSALVGSAAFDIDSARRRHRFRARADAILARMPAAERLVLDAYAAGVNAGLDALSHAPFEYSLLRVAPAPWQADDTLLVVYAMYFELQESDGWSQQRRGLAEKALGPSLATFLYPLGTPSDAPLDGSMLPEPALPSALPTSETGEAEPSAPTKGSNAFAVAGSLTASGSALVANDEHLGLTVPNIWYRARLRIAGKDGLDLIGTTLPGVPYMIAGSNTHVAWGFTNSYIETGDAILLDPVEGDPTRYKTPDGPQPLQHITESICASHGACTPLAIEETVWGPVVAHDPDGRPIVWRWVAQDANAIRLDGIAGLERATDLRSALDAAHRAGLPDQNAIIGDSAGHIAWTIAGPVPRRIGLDDRMPHSWADGTRGWQGYLAPSEIPEIIDPPDSRLWSANNRMVGGATLALLGGADYAQGDRARQIRDDLLARSHFAEADLLAIQLDDKAEAMLPWRNLLLTLLQEHESEPRYAALLPFVQDWGEAATIDSVGYRLVRVFQDRAVRLVYSNLAAPLGEAAPHRPIMGQQSDWPTLRLLKEQPPALVPKPYADWDAVGTALLGQVAEAVDKAGAPKDFTWGASNRTGIHHPLARVIPLLGLLTDPPDLPQSGDTMMPHVLRPGFGASERFVVSPGHEADGIFEMPTSEASNPFSPYYGAGHEDWADGHASPLLPGPPKWRLALVPAVK
ncbi:MAG TPA: penicillin acylase family protein [Aliidongia sp.]|nr:penicillin acylase family protein [Aliidongia sp.]